MDLRKSAIFILCSLGPMKSYGDLSVQVEAAKAAGAYLLWGRPNDTSYQVSEKDYFSEKSVAARRSLISEFNQMSYDQLVKWIIQSGVMFNVGEPGLFYSIEAIHNDDSDLTNHIIGDHADVEPTQIPILKYAMKSLDSKVFPEGEDKKSLKMLLAAIGEPKKLRLGYTTYPGLTAIRNALGLAIVDKLSVVEKAVRKASSPKEKYEIIETYMLITGYLLQENYDHVLLTDNLSAKKYATFSNEHRLNSVTAMVPFKGELESVLGKKYFYDLMLQFNVGNRAHPYNAIHFVATPFLTEESQQMKTRLLQSLTMRSSHRGGALSNFSLPYSMNWYKFQLEDLSGNDLGYSKEELKQEVKRLLELYFTKGIVQFRQLSAKVFSNVFLIANDSLRRELMSEFVDHPYVKEALKEHGLFRLDYDHRPITEKRHPFSVMYDIDNLFRLDFASSSGSVWYQWHVAPVLKLAVDYDLSLADFYTVAKWVETKRRQFTEDISHDEGKKLLSAIEAFAKKNGWTPELRMFRHTLTENPIDKFIYKVADNCARLLGR